MVTVVFALAVVNLGLGFALAVALDRLPARSVSPIRWRAKSAVPVSLAVEPVSVNHPPSEPIDEWSQKLSAADVEPKSAIERLLWIVKLETSTSRERLIALDRAFFDPHSPSANASELHHELVLFHQQLESWIAQTAAVKSDAELIGETLEELLLDQAFQLRSCLESLADSDRDNTVRQMAVAMSAFNTLRDRVDVLLCQSLMDDDRLHSLADRYRMFGEHETLTHLGLAAVCDEWWADDPDHVRLVSLVMLDLDRFAPFTQQVGAAHGDIALLRLGEMLHELLRKERGFDRVAQFSGQRFVLFLGDTSSKNAAKGAERIRQAVEATSFKYGEETLAVTASVAVIEVGKQEGQREFIARLEAVMNECKKAGRNCGFVDSGDGPQPIRLPQYPVSGCVIELDAAETDQNAERC